MALESLDIHTGPGFAILGRGALRLMLSAPGGTDEHGVPGGAGQAMPDGAMPAPGGWNRFSLLVEDLTAEMERLVAAGVPLRSNVITGAGGRQLLLEDPSGNLWNSLNRLRQRLPALHRNSPHPRRSRSPEAFVGRTNTALRAPACRADVARFMRTAAWTPSRPLGGVPGRWTTARCCSADCGSPGAAAGQRACSGRSDRGRSNSRRAPHRQMRIG